MADVKIHNCFPTLIYEFSYQGSQNEQNTMINYIVKSDRCSANSNIEDDLHSLPYFMHFKEKILELSKNYLNILEFEYEKLEITNMWANKLYKGDVHAPHTHSNSILSGVYYLKASNNSSPIQFFDPRVQAQVLRPRDTPNGFNASILAFNAIKDRGYIFPSWLMHWVPASKDERISISWNILLRGNYGEPGTLQNANI